MFRPDTRADLTRYEVFVEVDGKPYKITRTIQNWITYGWDTNQGSSQGGRSDYSIFGEKIHDNQAIVIQFTHLYNSKQADWNENNKNGVKSLHDTEDLNRVFKILLLDHYKNPQVIEMYDSKEAFESLESRVKVVSTTQKHIPKIPFWPFQGDGKDRYYNYDLKSGRGYYKYRNKDFETRSYFIHSVSDEVIEKIKSEVLDLKPEGVYRLESSHMKDHNGRRTQNRPYNHRSKKVARILRENRICFNRSTKNLCRFYAGEKKDGKWVMVEGKSLPLKLYFDPDSKVNVFDKSFAYEFELDGKMQKIERDPEYQNSFLNFDTKEYYGFISRYYKTREHK